ncbi:unnamed protein product, partial [Chrysoparadoxa australica]
MIQIGDASYRLDDPLTLAALGFAVLVLLLLWQAARGARRAARLSEPVLQHVSHLSARVQNLSDGQERLAGGLHHVSEAQANSQTAMLEMMERRLAEVQDRMGETLHGSARRTAHSLGELRERLLSIDKAQANITKLSGDVLSLQDILSNKQTRGAFGEIQLREIVTKALPSDGFTLQATLSNGRRADCLIHLPNPPGPIVVDAKFPLEGYEALMQAEGKEMRARSAQA